MAVLRLDVSARSVLSAIDKLDKRVPGVRLPTTSYVNSCTQTWAICMRQQYAHLRKRIFMARDT
jgi:hypothetical protein